MGTLAALFTLGALLKVNHPPIDAPDVRIGYYNLPLQVMLAAGLSLLLSRIAALNDWARVRGRVIAIGIVFVLLNLASAPRLAARVESGSDAPDLSVSAALVQCIERPRDAAAQASLAERAATVGWGGRYVRLCAQYRELGDAGR